jgi:hypothetical protein
VAKQEKAAAEIKYLEAEKKAIVFPNILLES